MSFIQDIKIKFRTGDSLVRIMLVNAGVFLLINIYLLILYLSDAPTPVFLGHDLALSASSSAVEMAYRPWSIITHMFAHVQFGHFIFNMIALYSMGELFISLQGSRKFTALYILGGLSGYFLFALSYSVFNTLNQGQEHHVLGASAATMAIVVATATLQPKRTVHLFGVLKLELMWLAGILVLLDLSSIRQRVNSGGHIGHIGGAIFGFFYARQMQKGMDMGKALNRIIDWIKSLLSAKKLRVTQNHSRPKSDEQFNMEKKIRQKKIDEILDRIGKSGYDSLSKEEKEFLFKNSQK